MSNLNILKAVSDLFVTWNKHNISYCCWKGTEHISDGLLGESDVDVLVDVSEKESAEKFLSENGYVLFKTQWGYRIRDVFDWIGFDKDTGKLIHIHLHYRMMCGHFGVNEYELPWSKYVLTDRVFNETYGLYTVNPELELLTLLTRLCLEIPNKKTEKKSGKYYLRKSTRNELYYLKDKISFSKLNTYSMMFLNATSDQILDLVDRVLNGNVVLPEVKNLVFSKIDKEGISLANSFKSFCYRGVRKTVFNWFYNKGLCLNKKVPYKRKGLSIAFLGQDGAGKSTVTKMITEWLSWKIDVRQFYLGSGDNFNPWEKRLQQSLKNSKGVVSVMLRGIVSVKLLSKIAKNVYKTIKNAESYQKKGGIALYDRYPQNIYAGINDGPKIRLLIQSLNLNKLVKNILLFYAKTEEKNINKAVSISPKIVIKLMLSPEESIRRKPFENYEGIKQKHEIIKKLEYPQSKVFVIDATQDYEEEIKEIKNIIWQAIREL